MAILVEREITHAERVHAFRDGINQIRAAAHCFIDNELWGALDETSRLIDRLERQHELFRTLEDTVQNRVPERPRKGPRGGIDIHPGTVRQARIEAGLSQAQIAGGDVTRAAICLIEKGRARPSMRVLQLIASRTQKPITFFTVGAIS